MRKPLPLKKIVCYGSQEEDICGGCIVCSARAAQEAEGEENMGENFYCDLSQKELGRQGKQV